MANGHGGARHGAGRPKKAEKYEGQIAAAEDRIADRLPQLLANLFKLAQGGYQQVEEEWQPAGLITQGSGEFESVVFPDLDAEQLVRTKRKVSIAAPDRAANIYLVDRILGKPTARVEADVDPDGTIEATAAAMEQAAAELAAWRQQMSAELPNISNAPPMPPMPATPTE